jgi:hypothetical protein
MPPVSKSLTTDMAGCATQPSHADRGAKTNHELDHLMAADQYHIRAVGGVSYRRSSRRSTLLTQTTRAPNFLAARENPSSLLRLLIRVITRKHRNTGIRFHSQASARIRSAAFSPIISTQALICAEMMSGIAEASATRRPETPRRRRAGSSGALGSPPIRHVPQG